MAWQGWVGKTYNISLCLGNGTMQAQDYYRTLTGTQSIRVSSDDLELP